MALNWIKGAPTEEGVYLVYGPIYTAMDGSTLPPSPVLVEVYRHRKVELINKAFVMVNKVLTAKKFGEPFHLYHHWRIDVLAEDHRITHYLPVTMPED